LTWFINHRSSLILHTNLHKSSMLSPELKPRHLFAQRNLSPTITTRWCWHWSQNSMTVLPEVLKSPVLNFHLWGHSFLWVTNNTGQLTLLILCVCEMQFFHTICICHMSSVLNHVLPCTHMNHYDSICKMAWLIKNNRKLKKNLTMVLQTQLWLFKCSDMFQSKFTSIRLSHSIYQKLKFNAYKFIILILVCKISQVYCYYDDKIVNNIG